MAFVFYLEKLTLEFVAYSCDVSFTKASWKSAQIAMHENARGIWESFLYSIHLSWSAEFNVIL